MEQNRELAVRQGRIWVKDGIYRLAMEQPNGPDLYIIVSAKPETKQVVFPKYKAYVELASDDVMSQMNDPFQRRCNRPNGTPLKPKAQRPSRA